MISSDIYQHIFSPGDPIFLGIPRFLGPGPQSHLAVGLTRMRAMHLLFSFLDLFSFLTLVVSHGVWWTYITHVTFVKTKHSIDPLPYLTLPLSSPFPSPFHTSHTRLFPFIDLFPSPSPPPYPLLHHEELLQNLQLHVSSHRQYKTVCFHQRPRL